MSRWELSFSGNIYFSVCNFRHFFFFRIDPIFRAYKFRQNCANGAALEMLCFNEGLFKWIKFSKGSVSLEVEDLKLYTSLSHIFIRYWLLASWNSKFFVGIFFLIYHLHQTWPLFLLPICISSGHLL